MPTSTDDLVGLADIASRLGVTAPAVSNWITRGMMPKPALVANRVRLWDWPEVEEWAKATGRIKQGMQIGSRLDIYRATVHSARLCNCEEFDSVSQ